MLSMLSLADISRRYIYILCLASYFSFAYTCVFLTIKQARPKVSPVHTHRLHHVCYLFGTIFQPPRPVLLVPTPDLEALAPTLNSRTSSLASERSWSPGFLLLPWHPLFSGLGSLGVLPMAGFSFLQMMVGWSPCS